MPSSPAPADPLPDKNSGGGGDRRRRRRDAGDGAPPSSTLWVGDISPKAVDADVMRLFADYSALDCNTMHAPSRSYSFVHFRNPEAARAAMEAIHGAEVSGRSVKIEFARPAKPCKHLWVGGISSSISKEQLEDEFLKFGKIEEFKFLKDRNSALIDYFQIEDAVAAKKNLDGKCLADEEIRVDFVRLQPSKKEWPDHHEMRIDRFSSRRNAGPSDPWMSLDDDHYGSRRHLSQGARRGESQPSNVLWIGYPPSILIDEQMLHNAMILFGEIERIRCFPSRHYSFVEFRSVDEARRAKEGLQGRLFNDHRIQILYSSSDLAPSKDGAPLLPGYTGPRSEMSYGEAPFEPLEFFGPGHPRAPSNFRGLLPPPIGASEPNMPMRPAGQKGFEHQHGGSDYHEFGKHRFYDDTFSNPNWRRQSPVPTMPPSQDGHPPFRYVPGSWDGSEVREAKRSRIDGSPSDDAHFRSRRMMSDKAGFDTHAYSLHDRDFLGQRLQSPAFHGDGELHGSPRVGHCWRGIIAKGGNHVCYARCVPVGKGINSVLPEIINCSAKTELEMLTKYYAEAIGFELVYFLPDSEEDFASYTEFLRYLGLRNRAGVAKLDDGTPLFLVPPSDFLTKVLKVSGPERLYGIVLRVPQQSPSAAIQQPQGAIPPTPDYIDRQQTPTLRGYNFGPQHDDEALRVDSRRPYEESMPNLEGVKSLSANAEEPRANQLTPLQYASTSGTSSQAKVSLTPELLSTLASLIPTNSQSMANGTVQMQPGSSAKPAYSRGWGEEPQATMSSNMQPNNLPQQLEHQTSIPAAFSSQLAAYPDILNMLDRSAQAVHGNIQIRDPNYNMSESPAIRTTPLSNYTIQSQVGQFPAAQTNQQYQPDSTLASQGNYGVLSTAHAANIGIPQAQQQYDPAAPSTHNQMLNVLQSQTLMPLPADRSGTQFPIQGQELPMVSSSSGEVVTDGDNRSHRYQSTLQFAANLLLQIKQQQQQPSSQTMPGTGQQQ